MPWGNGSAQLTRSPVRIRKQPRSRGDTSEVQATPFDSHLVFDIISAGVTIGWLVVGLLIKNNLKDIQLTQEKNKAELLEHQNQVAEDLNEKHAALMTGQHALQTDFDRKHAANQQGLAVHQAQDDGKFDGIKQSLVEIKNLIKNGH